MKKLIIAGLCVLATTPAFAAKNNYIGTDILGTLQTSPNIYYQMKHDAKSAYRFGLATPAGGAIFFAGYKYYMDQYYKGMYIEGDLGAGNAGLDMQLRVGYEWKKNEFIIDPNLYFGQGGAQVALNLGLVF